MKILSTICAAVGMLTIGEIIKNKLDDMIVIKANERIEKERREWYEMGYRHGKGDFTNGCESEWS